MDAVGSEVTAHPRPPPPPPSSPPPRIGAFTQESACSTSNIRPAGGLPVGCEFAADCAAYCACIAAYCGCCGCCGTGGSGGGSCVGWAALGGGVGRRGGGRVGEGDLRRAGGEEEEGDEEEVAGRGHVTRYVGLQQTGCRFAFFVRFSVSACANITTSAAYVMLDFNVPVLCNQAELA